VKSHFFNFFLPSKCPLTQSSATAGINLKIMLMQVEFSCNQNFKKKKLFYSILEVITPLSNSPKQRKEL
jgi:hypothetical protein